MLIVALYLASPNKMERTKILLKFQVDKESMVHPCNEILLRNKKEQNIDSCNNGDKFKCLILSDTRVIGYILYDCVFIRSQN
jgi:hypothetical protein